METKVIKFIQVWKSNQNGWANLTGGISPCLNVGQHHGTEPKIVEINEIKSTTSHSKGLHRSATERNL